MADEGRDLDNEEISIRLLLEAIYLTYGYDFRLYSKASVRRRVMHALSQTGERSILSMLEKVVVDPDFFARVLNSLTVNVTEMYRDPEFYRCFRERVIPQLRTHPFIKIWHAGCSTGEEIYSMAILLKEEGLFERTILYATDIDKQVLATAKKGIYNIEQVPLYSRNYLAAGGKDELSNYYTARYDHVIFDSDLRKNIVFADHDLATDQVFGEMHVVICRNVLIYFDRPLQARVFKLFDESLDLGGFLCLGSNESLRFSGVAQCYQAVDEAQKIFRRRLDVKDC